MSIKLASAILFFIILFVPIALADETTESFTVFTDKEEYIVGEPVNVYIYVKAEAIDPNQTITVTDVVVYDPNNSSVAEWHNLSVILANTTMPEYVGTFIATSEGEYRVEAKATGCTWTLWAIWFFFCRWWKHIIPEYPFGTIAAGATFLGAIGVFFARKNRSSHKAHA